MTNTASFESVLRTTGMPRLQEPDFRLFLIDYGHEHCQMRVRSSVAYLEATKHAVVEMLAIHFWHSQSHGLRSTSIEAMKGRAVVNFSWAKAIFQAYLLQPGSGAPKTPILLHCFMTQSPKLKSFCHIDTSLPVPIDLCNVSKEASLETRLCLITASVPVMLTYDYRA